MASFTDITDFTYPHLLILGSTLMEYFITFMNKNDKKNKFSSKPLIPDYKWIKRTYTGHTLLTHISFLNKFATIKYDF